MENERGLILLGSTGSIGTQTLEVLRRQGGFRVRALSAGKNVTLLEQQVREFLPELAVTAEEEDARTLADALSGLPVRVSFGMEGLLEAASLPGLVVTAVVGMMGIRPTLAAIEAGNDIALANKETLVTAGHLIMPLAREKGVSILPVDSEHSAIFQSLQGADRAGVASLILTASGGPFREYDAARLETIRPEDALKHPNWDMGAKITIDSATMVNKGLEIMEASWLFDVPAERIRVVVHPQSILHSAVVFSDGAVIGQLGLPDMKLPIQYALYYPKRLPLDAPPDLAALGALTFEEPREDTLRGLPLAREAIRRGGNAPTVFNAANEEAVAAFLARRIGFCDIYRLIEEAMDAVPFIAAPSLEDILATEAETRARVRS